MQDKPNYIYKHVLAIDLIGGKNALLVSVPAHMPHEVYSVVFIEPSMIKDLWQDLPDSVRRDGDDLLPVRKLDYDRLTTDFAESILCPVLIPTVQLVADYSYQLADGSATKLDFAVFDPITMVGLLMSDAAHVPVLISNHELPLLQQIAGATIDRIIPSETLIESVEEPKNLALLSMSLDNRHPVSEMATLIDNYVRAGEGRLRDLEEAEARAEAKRPKKILGESNVRQEDFTRSRQELDYQMALEGVRRAQESAEIYSSAPSSQAAIDQLVASGARAVVLKNPYRHDWAAKSLQQQAALRSAQLENPTGTPEELVSRLELTTQRLEARRRQATIDVAGVERLETYQARLLQAVAADPKARALAEAELGINFSRAASLKTALPNTKPPLILEQGF